MRGNLVDSGVTVKASGTTSLRSGDRGVELGSVADLCRLQRLVRARRHAGVGARVHDDAVLVVADACGEGEAVGAAGAHSGDAVLGVVVREVDVAAHASLPADSAFDAVLRSAVVVPGVVNGLVRAARGVGVDADHDGAQSTGAVVLVVTREPAFSSRERERLVLHVGSDRADGAVLPPGAAGGAPRRARRPP